MPLGAARITLLARTSVTAVAEVIRRKVGLIAQNGAQVDTAQSKFGGSSALFDGVDDDIKVTSVLDISDSWTIECWVNADSFPSVAPIIVDPRDPAGGSLLRLIGVRNVSGNYKIGYFNGSWQSGTTTLNTGTWYHLAWTYDGSTVKGYVNGTEEISVAEGGTFVDTKMTIGSYQSSLYYWDGYIDELRISKSVRYTSGFTAPTAPFVNDDDTLLLMHMNGTDASTFFEDDNGTGRSAVGVSATGAQVDTAQSKFGGASGYFSTSEDNLALPGFDYEDAWTFEGWYRFESIQDNNYLFHERGIVWVRGPLRPTKPNGITVAASTAGSTGVTYYDFDTFTVTLNTWYHIAVSKESDGSLRVFVDGTQLGSTASAGARCIHNNTSGVTTALGVHRTATGNDFNGWMDEVRLSNTARYTVAFTPSTTPFVNDEGTNLLLHMDGTDASTDFRDDNGVNSSVDPWNLDKTYFYASYDISGEDALPRALAFKPDGTKMYLCGSTGDDISQYSLGTAWDITTLSYDSVTVASGSTAPNDVVFNDDGTKMYVPGGSSDIDEFSLSTAWDLSTATNSSDPFNSGEFSDPQSCAFNNDGTKLFVSDGGSDTVYQYSLSTAYDISTGSYDSLSYDFSGQETAGRSVRFNDDGTRMYITGTTGDDINEYSLSSAFSLSSVTFVRTFSLANEDSNPFGIAWKPDGTKLYAVGDTRNAVFQYNVGYRSQVGVNAFDNAQIDTAESQFGGASAYFDGTNDYLLVDDSAEENFNFGTNDFTLEFWYKKNTTNVTEQIASNRGGYVTGNWYIQFDHTTDKIQWGVNGAAAQRSTSTFDDTSWHHLAITRNGGDFTLWIDGANEGELNGTTYVWGTSTDKYVKFGAVSTGYGNIWMDEVRISNTARYTSGFTPSTTQFQNDANTLLLLHCDGTDGSTTFVDDNGTIAG